MFSNGKTVSGRNIKSFPHSVFGIIFYFNLTFCSHEKSHSKLWLVFKLIETFPSWCANRFCPSLCSTQWHLSACPLVFGCTGRSFRELHTIFWQAAYLCDRKQQQQSTVQLPQSSQEELIFPLSAFLWGFVVNVRTALRESDRFVCVFHSQWRASSRPPSKAWSASFFYSPHMGRGGGNLMR